MNAKAESFQKFLADRNITNVFVPDEIKDDEFHTVVFRSHIDVNGTQLPTLVILDDSLFVMVRVLVAPQAEKDGKNEGLRDLMNRYNMTYKCFKYYLDDADNLVLDASVPTADDRVDGDLIYTLFDVIIEHFNDAYKDIMKAVWA